MTETPEPRHLFDIAGAVVYLRGLGAAGASKNFVRRLISTGQIPFVRIGRAFYISRRSLDGWLETHDRRKR